MEQNIDHHSFLVEHNLLTEEMKANIAMAGYCIVESVKDVTTTINFNDNVVTYNLLIPGDLCNNLRLLSRFENGESIGFWNSIKLKRFLKKKKEIDKVDNTGVVGYKLEQIANNFVKAYLNRKWSTSVKIYNADNKDESENFRIRGTEDQQVD